jgi:hypothetical protein
MKKKEKYLYLTEIKLMWNEKCPGIVNLYCAGIWDLNPQNMGLLAGLNSGVNSLAVYK